jgi:lysozyme family protein
MSYSDAFETALRHTLQFEKGYANSKDDAGGETYKGISRVANPNWPGWPIIDRAKAKLPPGCKWAAIDKALSGDMALKQMVIDLYRDEYYDRVAAFGFSPRLTAKLFDINVNVSPKNSNKILQRAVNHFPGVSIAVDGAVGPATIAAVKKISAVNEDGLLKFICYEQKHFYINGVLKTFPKARESFFARAAWLPEGAE